MCIEVHGSERRYLPRRRPVHNFLPQPLPAPPNPRTAGYIPPMATVNPNKKRKPSRCAGVRLAQAGETFWDYRRDRWRIGGGALARELGTLMFGPNAARKEPYWNSVDASLQRLDNAISKLENYR